MLKAGFRMIWLNYYVSKTIVKRTGENGCALDFAPRDPYFDTHRGALSVEAEYGRFRLLRHTV